MKISVVVRVNAKRERIEKIGDDEYKIYVCAQPFEGKANKKIIKLFAENLGISKSLISIIKGHRSNKKILQIDD